MLMAGRGAAVEHPLRGPRYMEGGAPVVVLSLASRMQLFGVAVV